MSSRTLAPPPSEVLRSESEPIVVRRAGPVLSPAWTPPRTGRGPVWISLLVHLLVIAGFVTFLRLGSPLRPGEGRGGPPQQVEYFDLEFPGSGTPVGIPSATAGPALTAPTSAPGATRVNGRAAQDEEEAIVFPRAPGARLPSPGGGAVGSDGGAGAGAAAGGQGGGAGAGGGAGSGAAGAGVGERLRPGYRDSRLYVDQEIERLKTADTRSDIQKYRERLHSLIEASNDSAWAQGSHPNTDWTVKDGSGRPKWGWDENGVYVGGVHIPKQLVPRPTTTGTNATIEAERQKEKDRQAIQAQEAARERKRIQDQAIKETRERKEAEHRKEAGEDGN
jgi:hypothetical protein